jgi:hypothetical protein
MGEQKNNQTEPGDGAPAEGPAPPEPQPEPAPIPASLEERLNDPEQFHKDVEEIKNLLLARRTSEALDLIDLLRSKRRLMTTNFVLGLFRGIGLFLGLTIVGALILGILAFTFSWIESLVGVEEGTTRDLLQKLVGQGETLKAENNGNGSGSGADAAEADETVEDVVRRILREENLIPPADDPGTGEKGQGEASRDSPPPEETGKK